MYNIGSKVRIKPILASESHKYVFGIHELMERYANKIMTIAGIDNLHKDFAHVKYRMLEDRGEWSWSISMFCQLDDDFIDPDLIV